MQSLRSLPSGTAILFDLDGTIIDSRAGIIATLHRVIAELGHEPDPSIDLTWVVGPPLSDLIGQVLAHYGETRVDLAITLYRHFYQEAGVPNTPVFPHIETIVRDIAASGAGLYLATSKPAVLARQILERHCLASCFDEIHGANPDDSGAEKPEMIAALIRRHGLKKHDCLMIGDRRFDISGAHANGVRGIGVLWGYGGLKELTEAGADMIVSTTADLPDAIQQQFLASAHVS